MQKLKVSLFVIALVLLFVTPQVFAQEADLLVQKSGPEEADAGDDVSYIVTVTNIGPDPASSVTLSDPVPSGMTFVSTAQNSGPTFACDSTVICTIATLNSGESAEFTFVFNIDSQTAEGTSFVNSATVSSQTFDPNDENNTAVAVTTTPPPPEADLFINKVGPNAAGPGSNVSYDITVGNAGPDNADFAAWTDTLPGTMTFVSLTQNSGPIFNCTTPSVGAGGTITCELNPFAAGASANFTLVVNIPANEVSGTEFSNTASVSAETTDPTEENNSSTTTLIVSAIDVSVIKSGPANVNAGANIAYTITVANAGPDSAFGVTLNDDIPAGTSFASFTQNNGPSAICNTLPVGGSGTIVCTIGTLPAAGSAQFTLNVTAGDATSATNTAVVTVDQFDTNENNNESEVTTTITPNANLGVVKSGPATITAGANITYTITVTNSGPSTATSVALTDTLPAGESFVSLTQNTGPTFSCTTEGPITCTIASFAPGQSATFTLVAHVAASIANGTVISNTASIDAATADSDGSNDSSTANTTVSTSADLAVTKSGGTGVAPGVNTTYTITVSNPGPSDAQSVTLTDILPAEETFVSITQNSGPTFNCTMPAVGANGTVSCSVATLVSGGNAVFTLVVQVAPDTPFGTVISNTATISSTTPDPNSLNDSSTTTATVSELADVRIAKTGEPGARAGTNTTYTITVTNDGPTDATTVQITDPIPAQTTFVSITQNSGPTFNCTTPAVGSTGTVTCTIASLPNGASAAFTLTVAIDPNATGSISNTATVTSANDPTGGNNAETAVTALAGANVPTLSTWGLMLLAAALALIVVFKR